MQSFLNKGNTFLHAIAIVYKKGYSFPEFVLTQKKPFLNMNDDLQEIIRANLIDLIVYAKKAPIESCELFSRLHLNFEHKAHILREFDNVKVDRTLNRCSIDENAFSPEKFKLGRPTPGEDNDYSGIHCSGKR